MHRDLNLANILIDQDFKTKICDLGLSKCDDIAKSLNSKSIKIRGTTEYIAPEQLFAYRAQTIKSNIRAAALTFEKFIIKKRHGQLITHLQELKVFIIN